MEGLYTADPDLNQGFTQLLFAQKFTRLQSIVIFTSKYVGGRLIFISKNNIAESMFSCSVVSSLFGLAYFFHRDVDPKIPHVPGLWAAKDLGPNLTGIS